MAKGKGEILRLPALAIRQGSRTLYSFAVDGKALPTFATVSRVHRNTTDHIDGYQRPEALAHIRAIKRYLESDDAILPNALVVAFDQRVKFEPDANASPDSDMFHGHLLVPVDASLADEDKP